MLLYWIILVLVVERTFQILYYLQVLVSSKSDVSICTRDEENIH